MSTLPVNDAALVQQNSVDVRCFMGHLPEFAETELDALYGHIDSRLALQNIASRGEPVNTYVASKNGRATCLLLFRLNKRKVHVINQMIRIDADEVRRFADYMFRNFHAVDVISFAAIQADEVALPYPLLRYNVTETFVLELPDTPAEYTRRLTKKTRESVRYYQNKLKRQHVSFSFETYIDGDIDEQAVRTVLHLKESRLAEEKRYYQVEERKVQRLLALARQCGHLTVIRIGSEICAGSVNLRVGTNYFGQILTHNHRYNDMGLGKICAYLTICDIISRGGRRFDLGEGRYEYKSKFLAEIEDIDRLEIYRSPAGMLLHGGSAARTLYAGYRRKLQLYLFDEQRPKVSRLARDTLYFIRKARERLTGLAVGGTKASG